MERAALLALVRGILDPRGEDRLGEREAGWLVQAALERSATCGEAEALAREWAGQRAAGRPLAYILGTQPFHEIELLVTPAVLVPRPETEELAERALGDPLAQERPALRGLDLGTGSGCLALALAHALPASRWTAVDISPAALEVARENARRLELAERVTFLEGSWWEPLGEGTFDLVVANPPYVGLHEAIDRGAAFEPAGALFAGEDGLADYRLILPGLRDRLAPGGLFLGEAGPAQGAALLALAREAGFSKARILRDRQGRERFLELRREA